MKNFIEIYKGRSSLVIDSAVLLLFAVSSTVSLFGLKRKSVVSLIVEIATGYYRKDFDYVDELIEIAMSENYIDEINIISPKLVRHYKNESRSVVRFIKRKPVILIKQLKTSKKEDAYIKVRYH